MRPCTSLGIISTKPYLARRVFVCVYVMKYRVSSLHEAVASGAVQKCVQMQASTEIFVFPESEVEVDSNSDCIYFCIHVRKWLNALAADCIAKRDNTTKRVWADE